MQLVECIYGMSKTTSAQHTESQYTPGIFRLISNPKRWTIIQYLYSARFATASVIQRKCQIKQPTVSRHLRSLTEADLLTREKIGTSVIYQINPETWKKLTNQLAELEKRSDWSCVSVVGTPSGGAGL